MNSLAPARGVLAIDAGQTGIKVRVTQGGTVREEIFPGILTHEPLIPQLAAIARKVLAGGDTTVASVAAGVSGLTSREADAAALLAGISDARVRDVRLAHDSTTSFLGALGLGPGAVVAAGTGVVTLAVGASHVARVDGWGHIMGDAGSGYWIGREALDAAMRSYDGRGPQTALRRVAEERWPDLGRAYIELQSSSERVSIVASFAADVARLAAEGDAVAQLISTRAGAELAHSVETALRRVDAEDADVCAIGGVFGSAAVREAFATHLASHAPRARIVEPLGAGLDGAAALADLPAQHPLAADLSVARG
ncbi:N-acetylglucosamine kinase [Microbacterium sp.]|uniref:N-acetylglucosamine kinase n=1 Tax=Microbacterium sp. TaxID=51671 RepID=UPI0035B1D540